MPAKARRAERKHFTCAVCGQEQPDNQAVHQGFIREPILELILKRKPDLKPEDLICMRCLNRFQADYVEDAMVLDRGELSELEREAIDSMERQRLISENPEESYEEALTFGQRMADKIARFGGSWSFIIIFGLLLAFWIALNTWALRPPADPYPYILLNLGLSCLAALQAPVIMMSQNRQEQKDRLRAENDYRINLKAELEIRHLHAKMDQIMNHQWRRLLEIQRIQLEMMERLTEDKK